MNRRAWGDALAAVFALAILGLLVRPNSVAPQLVRAAGNAMTALVSFATDTAAPSSAADSGTGGWVVA